MRCTLYKTNQSLKSSKQYMNEHSVFRGAYTLIILRCILFGLLRWSLLTVDRLKLPCCPWIRRKRILIGSDYTHGVCRFAW